MSLLERRAPGPSEDLQIVPYRRLAPSEMEFDPESGEPRRIQDGNNPLAGEVFETDEG